MAGDVLHDWHGTQPHERDGHGVGTHAVARGSGRGAGRAENGRVKAARRSSFTKSLFASTVTASFVCG
jgi:hypothetical protein